MTWKELKEKIESMPLVIQDDDVKAFCAYDMDSVGSVLVEKCYDNVYTNIEWDECVEGWELEEEQMNDPGTIMVAKKGEYVLWVV